MAMFYTDINIRNKKVPAALEGEYNFLTYNVEKRCLEVDEGKKFSSLYDNTMIIIDKTYNDKVELGFVHSQLEDNEQVEYNFYCSKSTLDLIGASVKNIQDKIAAAKDVTAKDLSFDDRNLNRCLFADAESFISFKIDLLDHVDLLDKRRNELKKMLMYATTSEDIDAIIQVIQEGW